MAIKKVNTQIDHLTVFHATPDTGKRVAEVVVVIDGMAVPKMPVEGPRVLKVFFVGAGTAVGDLAGVVGDQRTTSRHDSHEVAQLLHPPDGVVYAILLSLD
jgi:hypothetical protein